MKVTAILLVTALVAPATIAFGASAAIVSALATSVALSSIALSDYGKSTCTYHRTLAHVAPRAERHPLAA
jgi:hypothetical protein